VIGSYPVVARFGTNGERSFVTLPTYVERISRLGLVVNAGETWLAYRPVDSSDFSFDDVYVSRYSGGAWGTAQKLGTLSDQYGGIAFGDRRAQFAARMSDAQLHFFRAD
jgi:hypothetical protein